MEKFEAQNRSQAVEGRPTATVPSASPMILSIHDSAEEANALAAEQCAGWLTSPEVNNVMVAAGNTPLDLYRLIARRQLALEHLKVFVLDEYVGVPEDEPRNCTNLLRRMVVEAWGVPSHRFLPLSSEPEQALAGVQHHEALIGKVRGLDLIVLGLGQNGHLGFNEPGSAADSVGRVVDLDPISTEANRLWFNGDYAPSRGVTVGMRTILAARRVLLLAFGSHKADAVRNMVEGPRDKSCPASLLQGHPQTHVFLDNASASLLTNARSESR